MSRSRTRKPARPVRATATATPAPFRQRSLKRVLTSLLGFLSFLVPALAHKRPPRPAQALPAPTRTSVGEDPKDPKEPKDPKDSGDPRPGWPGQGEPAVEKARLHILAREAGGNYAAQDRKARWFGGYQFHLRTSNAAARRMQRPDLLDVPANQWTPEDQDAAFYVIYDRGRGKAHWAKHRRKKK